jgi:5-methylcytosine-specific restriction protein A
MPITRLYSLDEEVVIDPSKDLVTLCPNCQAILHRRKGFLMTIEEFRSVISKRNI